MRRRADSESSLRCDVTRDGHQEIITHSARPVRVTHLMRGFTESSELAHSAQGHLGAETMGCLHLMDDDVFT